MEQDDIRHQEWVEFLSRDVQQNLRKTEDQLNASVRAALAAEQRVAAAYLAQRCAEEDWERKQQQRAELQANQADYQASVRKASTLLRDLQDRVTYDWQRADDAGWNALLRRLSSRLREIRPEKQSALYCLRGLYANGTSPIPRRLLEFEPLMFALGELEAELEDAASLRSRSLAST